MPMTPLDEALAILTLERRMPCANAEGTRFMKVTTPNTVFVYGADDIERRGFGVQGG